MREGFSYKTAVDVAGNSAESTQEIPPPMQPLVQRALPQQLYTRVYFDLKQLDLLNLMNFFHFYLTFISNTAYVM